MRLNSDSKFKDFFFGFSAPFQALKLLLEHPKLFGLLIAPMVLTLLVLASLLYALLAGLWGFAHQVFAQYLGTYSGLAGGFITVIAGLLLVYFSIQTIGIFIALLSSPFNDVLAQETEKALGKKSTPVDFATLVRVFFLDLRKTILAVALLGAFTLYEFVPVVGILGFAGVALVNAFTYITYPLSRRKLGIGATLIWMRDHFPRALGFGFAVMLLFSIPVLNLFALPIAVISGTIVYLSE
jgi:CysZ protein